MLWRARGLCAVTDVDCFLPGFWEDSSLWIRSSYVSFLSYFFCPYPRTFFFHCFQRYRKRMRGTLIGCLPHAPQPGIMHAWTGNQTHNLDICPDWNRSLNILVMGRCSHELSHTGQGGCVFWTFSLEHTITQW